MYDPRGGHTILSYGGPGGRDLLQVQDPEGHLNQFRYDAQGHLIQHLGALGQNWRQTYSNGFLASRITPDGATWSFVNDSLGRPTLTNLPNGRQVRTTYDARDRVTQVNNSGAVSRTSYDANDLPLTFTDPLNRVTTNSYDAYLRLSKGEFPVSACNG
ncbi:unnamed protein product [Phaeothamnion confervicola]